MGDLFLKKKVPGIALVRSYRSMGDRQLQFCNPPEPNTKKAIYALPFKIPLRDKSLKTTYLASPAERLRFLKTTGDCSRKLLPLPVIRRGLWPQGV